MNIGKRVDKLLSRAHDWVDCTADLIREGYTKEDIIEAVLFLFKEEQEEIEKSEEY